MLVAVAVCPHPPALVPEIAQGAAAELDDLRAACGKAVAALAAANPGRITVVASGPADREWPADAVPDFRPYGVRVGAGSGGPLGLSVGAWLLNQGAAGVPRTYVATTGAPVVIDERPTALLVMADGTAMRTTEAPGYFDDRAEAYDADIAKALETGDADALERLDPVLGVGLWARGVPALHALGRTVRAQRSGALKPQLLYDRTPYGVGYFVALWQRSD